MPPPFYMHTTPIFARLPGALARPHSFDSMTFLLRHILLAPFPLFFLPFCLNLTDLSYATSIDH